MRAGHAFATGLKMAADELPAPAGIEFRKLYERQNYGAQLREALKAFADAVPSLDARFFVTAVLTQREAGGNLVGGARSAGGGHAGALPDQARSARAIGARPDHGVRSRGDAARARRLADDQQPRRSSRS